jgi:hypothetical protein
MAEVKAIKVLVDGLTFGSSVYKAGQIVLDATDEMLACAASRRTNDDGQLLCKTLSRADALKAAKRFDAGEEGEPVVAVPVADEEAPSVVDDEAPVQEDGGVEDGEVVQGDIIE